MGLDRLLKREVGSLLIEDFETDDMKIYFLEMCEEIPDYFFSMPSSTSGKYHNPKQCEKYGQLYHTFMFASILNHRLRLKGNRELYNTPETRDCMRCIPMFHDAVKKGWNGSMYTVANHPVLAAEWVRTIKVQHMIDQYHIEMIAGMCETHSGEWNKTKSGNVIMPEPRNAMELFIHECDILASRADLDWTISEDLARLTQKLDSAFADDLPNVNEYILTFGKHSGKTLIEVRDIDPGWITWAKANITREPVKTLLKEV